MREIWIVKVENMTWEGVEIEYQFSDGPPGERSISADYMNLEQGLAEHTGCVIHWWSEGNGQS